MDIIDNVNPALKYSQYQNSSSPASLRSPTSGNIPLEQLEDDSTDEFGKLILQHAREQAQFQSHASSGSAQATHQHRTRKSAFSKARTRPGVFERLGGGGDAPEDVQACGDVDGLASGGNAKGRKRRRKGFVDDLIRGGSGSGSGSAASDASEPATARGVRDWGRKGRRGNDWLRSIELEDRSNVDVVGGDIGDVFSGNRGSSGSNLHPNWDLLDTDAPIPTTEESPLSGKGSRQPTPMALNLERNSFDKLRQCEVTDEITFGSIITSTPAVPKVNNALEEIRRREIENVKEMAVTKSQLNRFKEQSPEEVQRKPLKSKSSKQLRKEAHQTQVAGNVNGNVDGQLGDEHRDGNHSNRPHRPSKPSTEQTSPIKVFKSTQSHSEVNRDTQAKALLKSPTSGRRRHDSQDLLRRLARVSSSSPSPAGVSGSGRGVRGASDNENGVFHEAENAEGGQSTTPPTEVPVKKRRSPLVRSNLAVEPALQSALTTSMDKGTNGVQGRGGLQSNLKMNLDEGVVEEKTFMSPKPLTVQAEKINQSKHQTTTEKKPNYLPTPDPDPEAEQFEQHTREPNIEDPRDDVASQQLILADERKYPKSALAAILAQAKHREPRYLDGTTEEDRDKNHVHDDDNNDDDDNLAIADESFPDHLGDSTIQSLEELISPIDGDELNNSGTFHVDDEDNTLQVLQLPETTPKTRAEKQRYMELLTLKEMNSRLKAARTSIRDASRGIKRVEQQVEREGSPGSAVVAGAAAAAAGQGGCAKCGCPGGGGSGLRVIVVASPWLMVKELLSTRRNGRRRLNWLGWIVVPLLCWYITEMVLW